MKLDTEKKKNHPVQHIGEPAGESRAPADIANRQYPIEVQRLLNTQVPNPDTGDA